MGEVGEEAGVGDGDLLARQDPLLGEHLHGVARDHVARVVVAGVGHEGEGGEHGAAHLGPPAPIRGQVASPPPITAHLTLWVASSEVARLTSSSV